MPKCILCGRSPRKAELSELSYPSKFLTVYSLRIKILYRRDHSLKSYTVHAQGAVHILGMGNGWHKIPCFPLAKLRRPQHTIGVLDGKLYWDDFPHFDHDCKDPECDGLGLTPGEINLLMGITPAERQPIDARTRQTVLDRYGHQCARCKVSDDLEIHHRRPVINGGTNAPDNLVPLCYRCHTQHAGEFTERFRPDLKSIFLNAEMRSPAVSETT